MGVASGEVVAVASGTDGSVGSGEGEGEGVCAGSVSEGSSGTGEGEADGEAVGDSWEVGTAGSSAGVPALPGDASSDPASAPESAVP